MMNRLSRLLCSGIPRLQRGILLFRTSLRQFIKKALYWSAITAIGFTISAIIFVSTSGIANAGALDYSAGFLFVLMSLIYYLAILPIGLLSYIMAYIFQVVVNYPHGSVWTAVTSSNGAFVNVPAVVTGWKLVRDVCNIFFSLILVIIALANVLKIEAYSWKKLLPKFILMAILINFSKTIAGVFTDLGTIAMATFGGSFGGSFGSALVGAFGLPTIGSLTSGGSVPEYGTGKASVLLGYGLTGVMTMIFFVVMFIFTALVLFRIVMLWFLIVLSPLAYITRILPQTEKHAKEWWERFGRWVTIGPLITFFLWLSLSFAFGSAVGATTTGSSGVAAFTTVVGDAASNTGGIAPSGAFASASPSNITNFIIATLMLMASLQIITGMAKEAGKITGMAEKAAWATGGAILGGGTRWMGLGLANKSNQLGNYLSGGKEGGSFLGNRVRDVGNLLGNTALLTGSTFFNPKVLDNISDGIKAVSKRKSAKLSGEVLAQNDHLVTGKAGLSNILGALGSFGLRPEWAYDNYLDPQTGLKRLWGSLKNATQTTKDLEANEASHKALESALEADDEKGDFNRHTSNDEARRDLKDYQVLIKALNDMGNSTKGSETKVFKDLADVISGTKSSAGVSMKTDHPVVKDFIAQAKATLEAQKAGALKSGNVSLANDIDKRIKDFESEIKNPVVNLQDLIQKGTFAPAGSAEEKSRRNQALEALQKGFESQRDALDKEVKARESKLINSSGGLSKADLLAADAAGMNFGSLMTAHSVAGDPTSPTFADMRAARVKQITDLENDIKRKQTALATYRPTEDMAHVAHTAHAESDAAKTISGIMDSGVLMDRLAEAIERKDRYLAAAIVKKITAGGDLDQLTMKFMTRYGITNGSADADGLEQFRLEILSKRLGMSDHDSMRIANDVSLDAGFNKRQQAFALAYYVNPSTGHLERLDPDKRNAWTAGEFKKKSVRDLLGYGAAQWGRKYLDADGQTQFEVDDAGLQLIRAFQKDLQDKHYFNGWSADAKAALSSPDVLAQLQAANISPELLKLLREYRQATVDSGLVRFAA